MIVPQLGIMTDGVDRVKIHQFGTADRTLKRGLMAQFLILGIGRLVVFGHQAEMMDADPTGIQKLLVDGRLIVMLHDQLDLESAAIAQGQGHIHIRGIAPVALISERTVLKQIERSDLQHIHPVFERGVHISDHIGQLTNSMQRLCHLIPPLCKYSITVSMNQAEQAEQVIQVEPDRTVSVLAYIALLDKDEYTRETDVDSPKIEYPCTWSFKIIGSDTAQITDSVVMMLEAFEYQFSQSRHSRTGKYTSFNLSVHVKSEAERMAIFSRLKHIPSVKVIL